MLFINALICLFDFYILSKLMATFSPTSNKANSKRSYLVAVLFASGGLFAVNCFQIQWINPLAFFVILTILTGYLYDGKYGTTIILSFFASLIPIVLEFVVGYIVSFIYNRPLTAILDNNPDMYVLMAIISRTCLLSVVKFVQISVRKNDKALNYKFSMTMLLPIISILIMYWLLYVDQWIPQNTLHSAFLLTINILLITTNIIIAYTYDDQQKAGELRLQLTAAEMLQKEQETVLAVNREHVQELAAITHDYKNQLLTIEAMLRNNDDEVGAFVNSLTGTLTEKYAETRSFSNNLALDSLLSYKLNECRHFSIDAKVQISYTKLDFLSHSAICAIFGNAIDNAITACQSAAKVGCAPYLSIEAARHNQMLCIRFENSKNPEDVVVKKGNMFATTKANANVHGFGIYNIQRAVDDLHGLLTIEHSDSVFRLTILLPLPDNG